MLTEDKIEEQNTSIITFIKWWEKRRITFNIIVGTSGLLVTILFGYPLLLSEPVRSLIGIFEYGIVLNICYTSGWVFELLLASYLGKQDGFGKYKSQLFWAGTIFSMLVTTMIAILVIPLMMIELH